MYILSLRHLVRSGTTQRLSLLLRFQSTQAPKVSDPLRVLFCGSDDFSSASLRALHAEQQRDPTAIESIDVLCRPGKRSGRSMKNIRDVPIKAVAQELGLPVHERDTFTGWELPKPDGKSINLIIAVSFGLFVPPRILKSTKYRGLNVHPSLLPKFRGAAPLQHTLWSAAKTTGVTLQTLDEHAFDNGLILAQTPPNGVPIPSAHKCTYDQLLSFITPMGAEILIRGIRDKVYVPPLIAAGWYDSKDLHPARKITVDDRRIDWFADRAPLSIDRQHRALSGRLWNYVCVDKAVDKRFIFMDIEVVPQPDSLRPLGMKHLKLDQPFEFAKRPKLQEESDGTRLLVYRDASNVRCAIKYVEDGDAVIIWSKRGNGIRVKEITVEGKAPQPASWVMRNLKDKEIWTVVKGQKGVPTVMAAGEAIHSVVRYHATLHVRKEAPKKLFRTVPITARPLYMRPVLYPNGKPEPPKDS